MIWHSHALLGSHFSNKLNTPNASVRTAVKITIPPVTLQNTVISMSVSTCILPQNGQKVAESWKYCHQSRRPQQSLYLIATDKILQQTILKIKHWCSTRIHNTWPKRWKSDHNVKKTKLVTITILPLVHGSILEAGRRHSAYKIPAPMVCFKQRVSKLNLD